MNRFLLDGYCVIEKALDAGFVAEAKAACYAAQTAFRGEVSEERSRRAGEWGVVRTPMRYDGFFYGFFRNPLLQDFVKWYLDDYAILHLQNAFILPPANDGDAFQSTPHRDFPRVLRGFRASINCFFTLSDFTAENGALRVAPGSHQRKLAPPPQDFAPVYCKAGALVVFDSTIWHCAGVNRSHADRIAVNHQFTRHYFKQQIDYVRALGEEAVLSTPPKTQRYLGWHSRPPASLEEYYRENRVYLGGQG